MFIWTFSQCLHTELNHDMWSFISEPPCILSHPYGNFPKGYVYPAPPPSTRKFQNGIERMSKLVATWSDVGLTYTLVLVMFEDRGHLEPAGAAAVLALGLDDALLALLVEETAAVDVDSWNKHIIQSLATVCLRTVLSWPKRKTTSVWKDLRFVLNHQRTHFVQGNGADHKSKVPLHTKHRCFKVKTS